MLTRTLSSVFVAGCCSLIAQGALDPLAGYEPAYVSLEAKAPGGGVSGR